MVMMPPKVGMPSPVEAVVMVVGVVVIRLRVTVTIPIPAGIVDARIRAGC